MHHTDKYFNFRDEILLYNELIMEGCSIVILTESMLKILSCLHKAHHSESKTMQQTKISRVFFAWTFAGCCLNVSCRDTCQEHHPSNPEIPLYQQLETVRPVQNLAAYLSYVQGRDILVMPDYHTSYIWTRQLHENTKTSSIIHTIMTVWREYGIPENICTDGAANFTSIELNQ